MDAIAQSGMTGSHLKLSPGAWPMPRPKFVTGDICALFTPQECRNFFSAMNCVAELAPDAKEAAIASILDLFLPEECGNYLKAAGYGLG